MIVAQRRVLVLNKNWDAVQIEPLGEAVSKLFKTEKNGEPKARVIDPIGGFVPYTWEEWSAMAPRSATGEYEAKTNELAPLVCPLCKHEHTGRIESLIGLNNCSGCNALLKITPYDVNYFEVEANESFMRSAHNIYRVPEVILLSKHDKTYAHRLNFSRRHVYRRDNYQCQYCGCKPGSSELTIDHVIPRAKGGETTWENCVLACVSCNGKKADRTLEQCGMVIQGWRPLAKRRKPVKPKFGLFKSDKITALKSWSNWISQAYWSVTLENDEDD